MQIHELIANFFLFSLSFTLVAFSAFFLFVAGDVALERAGVQEGRRQIIVALVILLIFFLIT